MKAFNRTSVGFCHIKEGTPCQDHSAQYQDDQRLIVTACDGHGGAIYIRSKLGSRFASQAVITVFKSIDATAFEKEGESMLNRIRLEVLCEWNALVERDLAAHPFQEEEYQRLKEDDKFRLLSNPVRAYGTTLHGAMAIGDQVVCIGIGDGGVFLVHGEEVCPAFATDEADGAVANITYSMCQEDAFAHLEVGMIDADEIDAVVICTDGTVNPYRNVAGFAEYLVSPVLKSLRAGQEGEVTAFVDRLGTEIGIGDDVSLSVLYKETPCESRKDKQGE